mmetsp:Transcript_3571/g.5768  ORF Transcript_3571/g.5768 Transcript_3571/m.5768 type:complete len:109 (-) Transcript_3571:27-353(-)
MHIETQDACDNCENNSGDNGGYKHAAKVEARANAPIRMQWQVSEAILCWFRKLLDRAIALADAINVTPFCEWGVVRTCVGSWITIHCTRNVFSLSDATNVRCKRCLDA